MGFLFVTGVIGMHIYQATQYDRTPSPFAWVGSASILLNAVVFFIWLGYFIALKWARSDQRDNQIAVFTEIAVSAARDAWVARMDEESERQVAESRAAHQRVLLADARRAEASALEAELLAIELELRRTFDPSIPTPAAQPYGVSHRGAEVWVAHWMQWLGEPDAVVTKFVGDGGIDVESKRYIAQVKNYSGSVSVAEVREFAGVASVDGRVPLFFTSGIYTAGALEFAERARLALLVYDVVDGTLSGVNVAGQAIRQAGL
ncbi:restriction endonuclease [Mycetocola tolaasinivorans]|nr:restriction endonuclease [Mycetocola tolaasinivorans]